MTAPPIVRRDGSWYTTQAWNPRVNGVTLHIPKGFPTDLASIPKLVRSFIDKEDLGVGPAIIHDYIYKERGFSYLWCTSAQQTTPPTKFTRRAADRIFREAMKQEGVGFIRRNIAWAMVRGFGWIPWPPSKTTLRNVTSRALHTLWQAGVGVGAASVFGWPSWTVPLTAGVLSAVKTLVQVTPIGERVKGTIYR